MQVMKSAIVDFNIPYGVIVRQDTVLDDGRVVMSAVEVTTLEELEYVRDQINQAIYEMKGVTS